MRRIAFLFCLTICLSAQQSTVSLNFIDSGTGVEPTGWVWDPDPNYSIATVDSCLTWGSQCALIRHLGENHPVDRVYIMQSVDATALRGKQVRYRASLRVEVPTLSQAQLFVRVDRPSGVGFSRYSLDQPIRSRDWTMREIVGEVDADAVRVTIGLMFVGRGAAYFADPEFEIVEN